MLMLGFTAGIRVHPDKGFSGGRMKGQQALQDAVRNTLERRSFIIPSFDIYGAVAGLFDYGPLGCAVKSNVLGLWRKHFVIYDDLLEIDCPCLTPEVVLKASGHVDKFTDLMVQDVKVGTSFRADHVVKDFIQNVLDKEPNMPAAKREEYSRTLARLDDYNAEELGAKIKEYGIKAPVSHNDLSDPFPFNLMFPTQMGRSGGVQCYLRPETAQGIFVNFEKLLYFNSNKMPFGAAQIGQAFRNEIAPRQGLLRVREFTLAEIEYFVDPLNKSHPRFKSVADIVLKLYPRAQQVDGQDPVEQRLGDAVEKGIIDNETLGYYIGRTYLFLTSLGIRNEKLRFRQHLANEMAHYAADCWDAEINCTYGWIECVGLADRSAYDLKAHSAASNHNLHGTRHFAEPVTVEVVTVVPDRKQIGMKFKTNQRLVLEALEKLEREELRELEAKLERDGEAPLTVCGTDKTFSITKGMFTVKSETKTKTHEDFTPSVIEPSFGIGRIIYCLFEHCFEARNEPKEDSKATDEHNNVLHFPPLVAPIKCTVFPLIRNKDLDGKAEKISAELREAGIANKIDVTARTIGKRYARTDEIGVPFAITVDFGEGVTVRDRDTKQQVRVPDNEVLQLISNLTHGHTTWAQVRDIYPAQEVAADVLIE